MIISFKTFEQQSLSDKFIDACRKGDVKVVKELLDKGIDPSDRNNEAMGWSVINGHIKVVKLLLSDPRVDPSTGENYAIERASEDGYLEIVKVLLSDKRVDPSANHNSAIIRAVKNGHADIVYLLLNQPKVYNKLTEEEIKEYIKITPPRLYNIFKKLHK